MKKRTILLAAVLVLLVGCAPQGLSPLPEPPQAETVVLQLSLSQESGETGRQLASLLARELAKTSRGRLELTIVDQSPAASLVTGKTDLALLTDDELAVAVPEMAFLDRPFVWSSPLHFTAGANAPGAMELADLYFARSLGASQLAAFYNGSPGMVSSQPLDGGTDLTTLRVAVFPDSLLTGPLQDGGLSVLAMEPSQCCRALLEDQADLAEADLDLVAQLSGSQGDWYWLPTYHRIQGIWLLLSDTAGEQLSQENAIALREAVAAVLQKGDRLRLEQETKDLEKAMGETVVPLDENLAYLGANAREYTKEQFAAAPGRELLELYISLAD